MLQAGGNCAIPTTKLLKDTVQLIMYAMTQTWAGARFRRYFPTTKRLNMLLDLSVIAFRFLNQQTRLPQAHYILVVTLELACWLAARSCYSSFQRQR